MNLVKNGNQIVVNGNILSFDDYDKIKEAVQEIIKKSGNELDIVFADAMALNSALIGFFIKCVRVDSVRMTMRVGNRKLYDMLETLSLVPVFNVTVRL